MAKNGMKPVRAFLAVCFGEKAGSTRERASEIFEELASLADTAGLSIVNRGAGRDDLVPGLYRLRRIDARTYLTAGIASSVGTAAKELGAELAVTSFELSPTQQSNLAETAGLEIRTKTEVIYEIFLRRSTSAISKIQIELANLRYIKSRLVGSYKGMDRIRGGIGIKGPGETKLEIDRRAIGRKIASLRDELARYEGRFKQMAGGRSGMPAVSIVGYTNAGKTSLLNALTGSEEKAEDRLFATVEVRTRAMFVRPGFSVLFSDTIGFIRDLPHHLIESFKTTLLDIRQADLILEVADASSAFCEEQLRVTGKVLEELGCVAIPRFTVYNKTDRLPGEGPLHSGPDVFRISVKTGEGMTQLREAVIGFFSRERGKEKQTPDAGVDRDPGL